MSDNAIVPVPQEIADHLDALEADRTHSPLEDLPTWYLRQCAAFDALEEQIRKQALVLLNQIGARRRSLQWRWGQQFKDEIDVRLASEKKRRSIDLLTGRAGYRTRPAKFTIIDEEELRTWCATHCPAALAVKIARTTPITDHIKATGEVPPGGYWNPPTDGFFPPILPVLPESPEEQKE